MGPADIGHHPAQDSGAVAVHHPDRWRAGGEGLVEEALEVLTGAFAVETDEVDFTRDLVGGDDLDPGSTLRRSLFQDLELGDRHPQLLPRNLDLRLRATNHPHVTLATEGETDPGAFRQSLRRNALGVHLGQVEPQRLVTQFLQPATTQGFVFLRRLLQSGDGLVEFRLGSAAEFFPLCGQLFGHLATLSFQLLELTLGLALRPLRQPLSLEDLDPLCLELLLQFLEATQPAVELEVLATEEFPCTVQHTVGDPHAVRDLKCP
jgi:hypothetical protein